MITGAGADASSAGSSAAAPLRLTIRVVREQTLDTGKWVWTGLADGYPCFAGGETVAELVEDAEAIKHFMTATDPGTQIVVDYVYAADGRPAEEFNACQGRQAAGGKADVNASRGEQDDDH